MKNPYQIRGLIEFFCKLGSKCANTIQDHALDQHPSKRRWRNARRRHRSVLSRLALKIVVMTREQGRGFGQLYFLLFVTYFGFFRSPT